MVAADRSTLTRILRSSALRLSLWAASGLPHTALVGQTVRGTLVSEGEEAPIEGAFASLVDPEGGMVDGLLTNAQGHFQLSAPSPGAYRVSVARIGFESWISEPLELETNEVRSVRYAIPIQAVRLAEIDVEVHRQCVTSPDQEEQVWRVWDEARKALETAAFARARELYRFETRLYTRELEPDDLGVRSVRVRPSSPYAVRPFRSLPASAFATRGYARATGDSITYYMPDAAALLSPEFTQAHCFGLDEKEDDEGRSLIGVRFRPVDRDVPEIQGVLWVDEASAELQTLEYSYVDLPFGIRDVRAGGSAQFIRLPSGAFVVGAWWIRMPQIVREVDFAGRKLRERIGSFKEDGGDVVAIYTARGERVRVP